MAEPRQRRQTTRYGNQDRVLARNEEFSKIAVIKKFYSSKKKTSYLQCL